MALTEGLGSQWGWAGVALGNAEALVNTSKLVSCPQQVPPNPPAALQPSSRAPGISLRRHPRWSAPPRPLPAGLLPHLALGLWPLTSHPLPLLSGLVLLPRGSECGGPDSHRTPGGGPRDTEGLQSVRRS